MMHQNRSILHLWTERTIRRLKNDPNYNLDSDLSYGDLIEIISNRGKASLRGYLLHWQLRNSNGVLFVGRKVTIRHKKSVSVGRSVIFEDYVYIDALSQTGVELGDNVTIAKFSTLQCTGVIQELGRGIKIGSNSLLTCVFVAVRFFYFV